MANYTNATNVSQFIQRALTANESASLSGYILNAVDKWINRKLQSQFDDVVASERFFEGGGHTIDIDPVQSVTLLKAYNNDGSASYTYTENQEFVLEPVNETVKREVVYRSRARKFPHGLRRIGLTGKFTEYDYTANSVPADIIMAATRLAAGILNAGKVAGQGGTLQEESLEGHSVRYDITHNFIDSLGDGDPIIQGMIAERREIYVETGDSDVYGYGDTEDWI